MTGPQDDNSDIPVTEAEFSRPIEVTTPGKRGRHFKFQATDDELAALARRYAVVAVNSLAAGCDIVPVRKGVFRMDGRFNARVVQLCVVSLDPVEEKISAGFTLMLQRAVRQQDQQTTDIDFMPDEEDIEFLNSDIFDAGEIIAQYLSLEINPYPRAPGARNRDTGQKIIKEEDYHVVTKTKKPFDLLKTMKHKT